MDFEILLRKYNNEKNGFMVIIPEKYKVYTKKICFIYKKIMALS